MLHVRERTGRGTRWAPALPEEWSTAESGSDVCTRSVRFRLGSPSVLSPRRFLAVGWHFFRIFRILVRNFLGLHLMVTVIATGHVGSCESRRDPESSAEEDVGELGRSELEEVTSRSGGAGHTSGLRCITVVLHPMARICPDSSLYPTRPIPSTSLYRSRPVSTRSWATTWAPGSGRRRGERMFSRGGASGRTRS